MHDIVFVTPTHRDALVYIHPRTLYSNNTGKIALQNVGRNVSGSSERVLASVLAPFLCVAREICDSLSVFAIARCASVVMSARRGSRSGRRASMCAGVDVSVWFPFERVKVFRVSDADSEDALGDW